MSTYAELVADALTLTDEVGNSTAEDIAELGCHQTLKYVASKILIDSLIDTATHTWTSSDTNIDLFGADFNITTASTPLEPLELYVGVSGDDGVPYEFRRFLDWKRLKTVPLAERDWISLPTTIDRRPFHVWTILDDKAYLFPEPNEDDVVTLYFRKDVAAYNGASTPEIPGNWQHILVNGAILYIEKVIKEEERIINPYDLLKVLDPQITEMDRSLRGPRSRPQMGVSTAYRVRRY